MWEFKTVSFNNEKRKRTDDKLGEIRKVAETCDVTQTVWWENSKVINSRSTGKTYAIFHGSWRFITLFTDVATIPYPVLNKRKETNSIDGDRVCNSARKEVNQGRVQRLLGQSKRSNLLYIHCHVVNGSYSIRDFAASSSA
jgi:hypothetical protein